MPSTCAPARRTRPSTAPASRAALSGRWLPDGRCTNTVPSDQGDHALDMDWTLAGPDLAALIVGYLLGSIPFGLLITRAAGLGDIRAIGSGNIGATNVLRTGHRGLAAATLLLDALKGTAAVVLAWWAFGPQTALAAA